MKQQEYRSTQVSSGFSVKGITKIELDFQETIDLHVHNGPEFLRILEGTLTLTVRGQKHCLKKDDVFVIFKGIPHALAAETKDCCTFYCLHCQPFSAGNHSILDQLMADTYLPSLVEFSFRFKNFFFFHQEDCLYQYIDIIYSEFSSGKLYRDKTTQLQMFSVLLLFLRQIHCLTPQRQLYTNQYLIPAFDYIKEHYPYKIRISDIAAHCNVSARYLNTLFLSFTDVPISQFLVSFRIDKAIEILAASSSPPSLTDIATLVGFSSLQHFSKAFKKEMGISPKSYQLLLHSAGESKQGRR